MTLKDKILAVALFAINLLFVPALMVAIGIGYLPWPNAIVAFVLWTWLMLPGTTWRDFAAGTNTQRVKHGCKLRGLPPPEERCLEPDHERVINWQLWLPAITRNFLFNATWGSLYFKDWPRWEAGFTKRMNRYRSGVEGPERKAEGEATSGRWLDRFDDRGVHT